MTLSNKFGYQNAVELARAEERISKLKAIKLFDENMFKRMEAGTFSSLAAIHKFLFSDLYDFAGEIRDVNVAKGSFKFAPAKYLSIALKNIDKMKQTAFDEIIEKYVEMNIAHPFRDGNGRSMRIWLDLMLKKELNQVIDWSKVDKNDYLSAMEKSPITDFELKHLLKEALTSEINNRIIYMKGIDASFDFEGLHFYKITELI